MGIFDFLKRKKHSNNIGKAQLQANNNSENDLSPAKDMDELKLKFTEPGLKRLWKKVQPSCCNSVTLKLQAVGKDEIKIGTSKLGGCPDLPIGTDWPYRDTTPLSFIAQINLSELNEHDIDNELPEHGMIYFFYDIENQPWGMEAAEKNAHRVLFFEGDFNQLAGRNRPIALDAECEISPAILLFDHEVGVPPLNSACFEDSPWIDEIDDDDFDTYTECFSHDEETHKMLGYPDDIQDSMEEECYLVTEELFDSDINDWKLLLQIDSNEQFNMMWGDSGRIFFWIRKQDLLNKDFTKTWLILQCY